MTRKINIIKTRVLILKPEKRNKQKKCKKDNTQHNKKIKLKDRELIKDAVEEADLELKLPRVKLKI